MDFDDLDFEARGYKPAAAYGQSKLANLLFTFELTRRLEQRGAKVIVAAAHPGWTQTNLQKHARWLRWFNPLMGMQPIGGELPTLRAATGPGRRIRRLLWAQRGFTRCAGHPRRPESIRLPRTEADATRLWNVSEERDGRTLRVRVGRLFYHLFAEILLLRGHIGDHGRAPSPAEWFIRPGLRSAVQHGPWRMSLSANVWLFGHGYQINT